MSKPAETPKYSPNKRPSLRCSDCGLWTMSLDQHECGEQQDFDGTCPMCGEQYRSFGDHLQDCEP